MITQKSERLAARVTPETMRLLRRAADIKGRSVSDFVVAAAHEAAQEAIADMEMLELSRADQEQFMDRLLTPPDPNDALQRAFEQHRDLVEPR